MAKITSFSELQQAISKNEKDLVIQCSILCYHSFVLPENAALRGETGKNVMLCFNNGDGVGLSVANTIKDINIQTASDRKAVYLSSSNEDLGSYRFENLTLTGQFSFIARTGVLSADITVLAENICIGRTNAPVIGSGIFIAGAGDRGGKTIVSRLHTGAVHSTGMLPFGVADMITAGIFIVNGCQAKEIVHDGEIVTYGVNDMVLDTWGEVESWTCNAPVISYGPSGVGFVNFGIVGKFIANAPLETYGLGARGYNQYDGTVEDASFHSVTTYGDGSVGVQISKAIGKLTVLNDITTYGSIGNSLVKGVNVQLPAVALSIKPGGEVQQIEIKGSVVTHGDKVISYEVNEGIVHDIRVEGAIIANGSDSIPISIENNGSSPVGHLRSRSAANS